MQMYVHSGIEARKHPQLPCPSSSAKGCDRWITHSDVTRLLKDYPKDLQVRSIRTELGNGMDLIAVVIQFHYCIANITMCMYRMCMCRMYSHHVFSKEGMQRIADGIKAAALAAEAGHVAITAEAERAAIAAKTRRSDRAPAAIIPPRLQNHDSAKALEKLKPVHKAGSLGNSTNNPDGLLPVLLIHRFQCLANCP